VKVVHNAGELSVAKERRGDPGSGDREGRLVDQVGAAAHAADVDATARFPREAYNALAVSGFHAPHVLDLRGEGADAPTRATAMPGSCPSPGLLGFDNDTAMMVTVDRVRLLAKPDQ
jgi:hypothetical protein